MLVWGKGGSINKCLCIHLFRIILRPRRCAANQCAWSHVHWNLPKTILTPRKWATMQSAVHIKTVPFFHIIDNFKSQKISFKAVKETQMIWILSLITLRPKKCATMQWVKTLTICNMSMIVLWCQSKQNMAWNLWLRWW